jgi:hypothetical protein
MSQALLDRANTVRANYKTLEGVRGSGFHPMDKDSTGRIPRGPAQDGLNPASEHLVAFHDKHEGRVQFVGPDAEKMYQAFQDYAAKLKDAVDAAGGDMSVMEAEDIKLMTRIIPRIKLQTSEGLKFLDLHRTEWNAYLRVAHSQGTGVWSEPL